ncbi:MAG: hypothetical protein JXQ87_13195 [Bacteroidia bacterium]
MKYLFLFIVGWLPFTLFGQETKLVLQKSDGEVVKSFTEGDMITYKLKNKRGIRSGDLAHFLNDSQIVIDVDTVQVANLHRVVHTRPIFTSYTKIDRTCQIVSISIPIAFIVGYPLSVFNENNNYFLYAFAYSAGFYVGGIIVRKGLQGVAHLVFHRVTNKIDSDKFSVKFTE